MNLFSGCGDLASPLSHATPFLASANLNHCPTVPAEALPHADVIFLQGTSDTAWLTIVSSYTDAGYATCWRSPVGPGPGMQDSADPGRLAVIAKEDVTPVVHSNLTFSIEGTTYRPSHAPVEIALTDATGQAYRLWNLHAHSKAWHPAGQHEVRRNEARLAWQAIRKSAKAHPEETVVVAAALNDDPGSAASDYFTNGSIAGMTDLRPTHRVDGTAWTHHHPDADHWVRQDFLMIRPAADQIAPFHAHLQDRISPLTRRSLKLERP